MTKEEKQAIEYFKSNLERIKEMGKRWGFQEEIKNYEIILNLIDKQQKEIEDKNQFIDELQFRYNIEHQSKIERYISKDKIREKIKELEKECEKELLTTWLESKIEVLQELLGDE